MAREARKIAIQLGCKGIRHGDRVKKPTTLLATFHAVLTHRCAMSPPELKKNTARLKIDKWKVNEVAPGYAELGLHWHAGLHRKVPLGDYATLDRSWKAGEAELERQRQSKNALAETDAMMRQFGDDGDSHGDYEINYMVSVEEPYIAPHDPNVFYVHYEDAKLQECLDAWRKDESQRKAAASTIFDLIAKRAAELGIEENNTELVTLRRWKTDLSRLETRERIANELDVSLPKAKTDGPLKGARVARETYAYTADGEGRRYSKGERWCDGDGEKRSATGQGMPGDLRLKLLGWKFADSDGRKSDPTIYVIVSALLGLPHSSVNILIDEYLITDEVCNEWHDDVAKFHGTSPEITKRWPNIFGNGGTYETCLVRAGLSRDSSHYQRVEKMETQLKKLRLAIVKASREIPNALWPGSENFVNKHDERLQRERPGLDQRQRFNKIFSYLMQTAEDRMLTIHAHAQRAVRRDALGSSQFDALPPEVRDTGLLAFDGLATERVGGDIQAGDKAAEKAIVSAGWHAQRWGIEYKIVEKPMFGKQHVKPDDFESAKGARHALQDAAAAYPEVQEAIEKRSSLQKQLVSESTVCGEKRSRDDFLDGDEDAPELEAI